jgi:NRPS condensation-like uncharacterized protein
VFIFVSFAVRGDGVIRQHTDGTLHMRYVSCVRYAELNILDELYMHLNRPDEPWGVHLEVGLAERMDADRLADAVRAAADHHPVARARLADWRGTDVRYRWEIDDALESVPLEVVDCSTAADLADAREKLFGFTPALEEGPPFALTLAHHPDGDSLLLNLHHGAGDGIGIVRLMASILRAYAGEDDPDPAVDPLEVRDIGELTSAGSLADRLRRGRALVEHVSRFATSPTRVAPDGGTPDVPAYGFELLRLDAGELETVMSRRTANATVNDVLLAALGVAIRRWNESHDADVDRMALMMPVNLRPEEWRTEVLGNFASYVTVHLASDEQDDLPLAVEATAERTDRIKRDGVAGLIVDLLEFPSVLPAGVKRRLQELIPLTGNRTVDTAVLSNLGRLDALPLANSVWFSPPGRMPLGVSLGTATLDGELFVTFRYRHALFDAAAAADFAALYREVLIS